jgi:serine/threonine protein kinase
MTGDLRCTNILVTKDMNVKITDFGISLNKNVNVKPDFLHTLYVNDKEWYEEIQEDNLLNQKKAMFTQFLDVRFVSTLLLGLS